MSKLATILISVFYLTVTIGLAVNVHYCQGELQSVGLSSQADDCCCGDVSGDADCCRSEVQFITFENDQTPGSRLSIQPQAFDLLTIENRSDDLLTRTARPFYFSSSNMLRADLPAWLLFCSLVYYG